MTEQTIKPLVASTITVPGSNLSFLAACFEGKDWSLGPLQQHEDVRANKPFADKLAAALRGIGVKKAYAPNPVKFNAKIIKPGNLQRVIVLGERLFMLRNQDYPADGTFLYNRGDAGIFSAGGCGVIVVSNGTDMVFAHAGRECLLDRKRVLTLGKEQDRETDVVENAIVALGSDPKDIHLWALYFIRREDFYHRSDDLKHGEYNRAAVEYLPGKYKRDCGYVDEEGIYLDLPGIAYAQARACGVPAANIHLEHEYLSDELPHTRNGGGRYLVAIVRQ